MRGIPWFQDDEMDDPEYPIQPDDQVQCDKCDTTFTKPIPFFSVWNDNGGLGTALILCRDCLKNFIDRIRDFEIHEIILIDKQEYNEEGDS